MIFAVAVDARRSRREISILTPVTEIVDYEMKESTGIDSPRASSLHIDPNGHGSIFSW
jgi:hypothetical protein